MNPVLCRKRKLDGTEKAAWRGDLVAATEAWLVVFFDHPAHRTEDGDQVAYALRYYSEAAPLSVLVSFDERGEVLEYQCDAGLPTTRTDRELTFVDLDLDLIVTPEFESRVRDEDTFTIHRFVMGYPDEVVGLAHAGLELAQALTRGRVEPFDSSPALLLGKVLAARGPL